MDINALTQLDYYRIRSMIAGCCCAQESSIRLLQREPLTDSDKISRLQTYGREWISYVQSGRDSALSGWEPVADILTRLQVMGTALSQSELFALGTFCKIAGTARLRLGTALQAGLPVQMIASLAASMPDTESVQQEIFHILDKDGQIRDLPELRVIRERIRSIRNEIETAMRRYTSDSSLRTVLQSDVPVLRADRQVLAVRSGQRGQVRGIIHEVSQTGQTVYIEPEEVVRRNNELVQEEFLLEQETRRILRELTARIASHSADLYKTHECLIELDMALGAARWGCRVHGIFAGCCTGSNGEELPPVLKQARHPLFAEAAVPIDIIFAEGCRMLIITGPNTGGKTAAIKTFALFSMLNQSGFPIPAAEGTRLPIFTGIFADIGDSQSLDESLSTFSGHMRNISAILEGADRESLVLLDELGSGTDPQEGSAIAMAVLDELIIRQSFVLVTTHHGILKNYGYTHSSCVNASVAFDTETLAPSYRIVMGVPGESRALEIARRSGLPPLVVEKARAYIGGGGTDISALINGLTQKHHELDTLLAQTHEREAEAAYRESTAVKKELEYRQKELELRRDGAAESRRFLEESRRMLENLVRELREGEITREKTKAVKQFISDIDSYTEHEGQLLESEELKLEQDIAAAEKVLAQTAAVRAYSKAGKKKRLKNAAALAAARAPEPIARVTEPLYISPGAEVMMRGSTSHGIAERREKNGNWLVRFGSMKMSLPPNRLIVVKNAAVCQSSPVVSVDLAEHEPVTAVRSDTKDAQTVIAGNAPVFELRLLGMRCEEAVHALERQLDLAGMQGLHAFSIIHGKGSGALQNAVHEYLKTYPGVAEFHFAPPEDGGTGKTYVTLV